MLIVSCFDFVCRREGGLRLVEGSFCASFSFNIVVHSHKILEDKYKYLHFIDEETEGSNVLSKLCMIKQLVSRGQSIGIAQTCFKAPFSLAHGISWDDVSVLPQRESGLLGISRIALFF